MFIIPKSHKTRHQYVKAWQSFLFRKLSNNSQFCLFTFLISTFVWKINVFLSKICKSCSCETRRWSFISTIIYWSKDWLAYSRWSSSSLYTVFQRFSKEYNISISIEWNLLLKWKPTSLCCKRCTFRLVYRKANVNLITFSKGLVTRHQSFKTYITSKRKPNSVNGTKIKEII